MAASAVTIDIAIAIAVVYLCEDTLSSYYSATPILALFLPSSPEDNKEFHYTTMIVAWLESLLSEISCRLWSLSIVRIVYYDLGKMGLYECSFEQIMAFVLAHVVAIYTHWCFRAKHVKNTVMPPECKKAAATLSEVVLRQNTSKMNNEGASKIISAQPLYSLANLKMMDDEMYPPLSTVHDLSPRTCCTVVPTWAQDFPPPPDIYC